MKFKTPKNLLLTIIYTFILQQLSASWKKIAQNLLAVVGALTIIVNSFQALF